MFGKFIRWPMMQVGSVELPTTIKAVDAARMRRLVDTGKERGYSGDGYLELLWDRVSADQRFYLQPFSLESTPDRCYRCSCVTDFAGPDMWLRFVSIDVEIKEFEALPDIGRNEFFLLLNSLMRMPADLNSELPDEER